MIIETDSQILVDMVKGKGDFNWKYRSLSNCSCLIKKLILFSDFFANKGVKDKADVDYSFSNSLPIEARLHILQDQRQLRVLCKKVYAFV